jgi:hypothetical protein
MAEAGLTAPPLGRGNLVEVPRSVQMTGRDLRNRCQDIGYCGANITAAKPKKKGPAVLARPFSGADICLSYIQNWIELLT